MTIEHLLPLAVRAREAAAIIIEEQSPVGGASAALIRAGKIDHCSEVQSAWQAILNDQALALAAADFYGVGSREAAALVALTEAMLGKGPLAHLEARP